MPLSLFFPHKTQRKVFYLAGDFYLVSLQEEVFHVQSIFEWAVADYGHKARVYAYCAVNSSQNQGELCGNLERSAYVFVVHWQNCLDFLMAHLSRRIKRNIRENKTGQRNQNTIQKILQKLRKIAHEKAGTNT